MSIDNSSNSEKLYLSIDIGGSAIKYGVLDETFSFVYKSKMPSKIFLGGEELLSG
jgi:predicted NBD/HSP70 family sugar kinase